MEEMGLGFPRNMHHFNLGCVSNDLSEGFHYKHLSCVSVSAIIETQRPRHWFKVLMIFLIFTSREIINKENL